GPIILLKDLPEHPNLKIVGIDLTGSEARATGWCLLSYNTAMTSKIFTDEEIINETIRHRPNIISIDSPLSLPTGRKSIYDSDPTREQFGITRFCERTLRKRGVSVYPCLIPSMQKLTERGIKLAQSF